MRRWLQALHGFVFGTAISWVAPPYLIRRRQATEGLFILLTEGHLLGMPLIPQRGRLLLLPYVIPAILSWRRRLHLWDDSLEMADLKHIGH